jgi:sulfur relay (sulfurtransferase) DsrC/TusE family protein
MESAWGFADWDSDRLIRKFFSRCSFPFPFHFSTKKEEEKRERERCNLQHLHRGSATPAAEGTSVATKSSALVRTIILM